MDGATRVRLVNILTDYDRRQSSKRGYNRYALGHYLRGVSEVAEAMQAGKPLAEALKAAFCGSLLRHVARKLGVDPAQYSKWD